MATRNIVPRADGEGTLGTTLKRWLGAFFKWLDIEEYIQFNPNDKPAHQEGRIFYDAEEHAFSAYNENSEVTHNLGQEHIVRVHNDTGFDIPNGKVVRIEGVHSVSGDPSHPLIILAQADLEDNAHALGMTTTNILNEGHGYVTRAGVVHGLDTTSFTSGDKVYLSDTVAGELTTTKPTIVTIVGVVLEIDATDGSIIIGLEEFGAVGADMLKSVYDPDVDGVVDEASSIQIFARHETAGTIDKGTPVYLVDYNVGGWIDVDHSDADILAKMPAIGIASEDLTNLATGKVTIFGRLEGLNTSSWGVGDALYVSTTEGLLTNVKPQGNNYIQKVAQVIKSDVSDGIIEVFGAGRTNDIPNMFPYTEKVIPHDDDTLFLEDSEDAFNKKKLKINSLLTKNVYDNDEDGIIDIAKALNDGSSGGGNEVTASEARSHIDDTNNPHQITFMDIANIQAIASEAQTDTTSLTYVEKVKLTFTPPEQADYIISWYYENTNSNVNKGVGVRIELDDTTELGYNAMYPEIGDDFNGNSGFAIVNLTPVSHDIDIDFKIQSTGTGKIRRVRVYARKVG